MSRQINHKTMRVVVGTISLALSPLVLMLSGTGECLSSISSSYWTDARDVFVGSLVAVGFFLSAYNGSEERRDLEYYLSKAACIFALCVALFPTSGGVPAKWVATIASVVGLESIHVHYGAAIALFVCLIVLMWFFSVRAMCKEKKFRAYLYRAISVLMASGIVGFILAGNYLGLKNHIFILECWGLSLFGLGWLIAGSYKTVP